MIDARGGGEGVERADRSAGLPVRPAWLVSLEHVSISVAAALLVVQALAVFGALRGRDAWLIVATLLLALLVGDALSGLVHWIGDTFFDTTTPILGPAFVEGFREHHHDPQAIVRHGFAERNGANAVAIVLPLLAARLAAPPESGGIALAAHAFLLFLTIASCATNQIHMWAHTDRVPRLVGWLQRARLVMSPEHHRGHHCGDFRRRYCVTTGWLNPVLDRLDFWARCERRLRSLSLKGARPRRVARLEREEGRRPGAFAA